MTRSTHVRPPARFLAENEVSRDWFGLQRVRPLQIGAGLSDDWSGHRYCPPFEMAIDAYVSSPGPMTSPQPRCLAETTVGSAVCEVFRRAPDEFFDAAPSWLTQCASRFLEDDVYRLEGSGAPSRLSLLDGCGFAEAFVVALETARKRAAEARVLPLSPSQLSSGSFVAIAKASGTTHPLSSRETVEER